MANVERIRDLREFLTEHPEQHDQGEWGWGNQCGTAACAAGWAVLLFDEEIRARFDEWASQAEPGDEANLTWLVDVDQHARELLGLADDQASEIFYEAVDTRQVEIGLRAIEENPGITGDKIRELY